MEMKGEYRISLPQDMVWRGLNDLDVLKASIPGCEELIRESDTTLKARLFASVGPVRARFSGDAVLSEIDPPNGYTLTGSGAGGPAGMAKGGATVRLRTEDGVTVLTYEAHAQVAGKLAQIGSRLVDMAAKKMADDFFGNFVAAVQAATWEGVQPVSVAEAAATSTESNSHRRSGRVGWGIAAVAAIIVIIVLLVRFS